MWKTSSAEADGRASSLYRVHRNDSGNFRTRVVGEDLGLLQVLFNCVAQNGLEKRSLHMVPCTDTRYKLHNLERHTKSFKLAMKPQLSHTVLHINNDLELKHLSSVRSERKRLESGGAPPPLVKFGGVTIPLALPVLESLLLTGK